MLITVNIQLQSNAVIRYISGVAHIVNNFTRTWHNCITFLCI